MGQQVLKSSNEKMEKAVAAYSRELATVRAWPCKRVCIR